MQVNGILLLNKLPGKSSNASLQIAKRLYNADKAGHAGTLDPFASGLLPICFGEATKFVAFPSDASKEYIATIKLGIATSTYDIEGEIIATAKVSCSYEDIEQCVANFKGDITQVPPIYSALKVNGRKLYDYARQGIDVAITPRKVTIYELEILEFVAPDIIVLRTLVSKGTYIRSLAHDIGQMLNCGAHLTKLLRTQVGSFRLNPALTLEAIDQMPQLSRKNILLPIDAGILDLPCVEMNDVQYQYIRHGHGFILDSMQELQSIVAGNNTYRLYFNNQFLGTAEVIGNNVKPLRLLNMQHHAG